MKFFVAFASKDNVHAETIQRAANDASGTKSQYLPWSNKDGSGVPVDRAVDGWLDDADGVVADVTYVNDNVTYEIGFTIGSQKDLRLIRNSSVPDKELSQIGLLNTIIRDEFKTRSDLVSILKKATPPKNKWPKSQKNLKQPIYVLAPPSATPFATKVFSSIKKKTRFGFRSFKAWEISRLTAAEAWEQVSASFGVVVTWSEGSDLDAQRNNQKAALIYGMARGNDIPILLLAHTRTILPADINDQATRFSNFSEIDGIMLRFRDHIQDAINEQEVEETLPLLLLDQINIGDPAAENEAGQLRHYFLETEEFKRTLRDEANLILGRKGSGKTAIFLQVRDRVRADKRNIVVDLNPEGYQLVKLKEIIIQIGSLGARKEIVAAFWQYVLWLEIAYKILEKDDLPSKRDSELAKKYQRLQTAFTARVDTGFGDFSERLLLLTESIEERFEDSGLSGPALTSSEVLEVVYGTDVAEIRNEILEYLNLKGEILFLFDNLDRMRSPSGFDEADGLMILGLVESMQSISKQFRRNKFDFRWVVFVRSDVYEFIVRGMADYGKHAAQSLEWDDEVLLKRLLRKRIEASTLRSSKNWKSTWNQISVLSVGGVDVFDFLVSTSLMRPRYMIRLFESAKRRAINMGQEKIEESDYIAAKEDLGWTVMEDLDLELMDVVQNSELLLFDIGQLDGACGLPELRDAIAERVGATEVVDRVIDVLLWSGAIGIAPDSSQPTFIFDCGYKIQFLRSLIDRNPDAEVCLHETLSYLFRSKPEASIKAA